MEERYELTKKVGVYGIIGNIFLLIIKAISGFLFNSQSMIADAFNSAGDIFASLMTFIGNNISNIPKDENHNLGHGKAEYIFSLFISISMIGVSFKLLFDSSYNLFIGEKLTFSWLLILVCFITIIVKFSLYIYTKKISKKINNLLLKSNLEDHRNDCIITTFTTISILLTFANIYWFDGVVGVFISIWIAKTGLSIFWESYNVLMDVSIDSKTKEKILACSKKYRDIIKVQDVHSAPTGYKHIIFLTIYISGSISTYSSHEIADSLEKDILKLPNIDSVIIHVNPI